MAYIVKSKSVIDEKVTHRALLIKITEDDRFVRFMFSILDLPTEPIASGICPKVDLEPGTRLYKWFSGLNGGELVEGDSINPEDFISRVVEVKLKNTTSKGIEYTNVVDVIKLIQDSEY
jgi:hypothetical protein